MTGWSIERILHFGPDDLVKDRFVHFGFHDRDGHQYLIEHQRHFLALLDRDGGLRWTVAAQPVFSDVPNIFADLEYPIYVDVSADGSLLISNFGNARLFRVDIEHRTSELLVDGHALGMEDMGNCVIDDEGGTWVNEVRGCRVWRFDAAGRVLTVLGDGHPGFQRDPTGFDEVRFSWIYDLRRGPGDTIYVLDSGNFALRAIFPHDRQVRTLAGNGTAGYSGDGGDARDATFGSDPRATFDGPISLSVDARGNAYVGDRFNHVVRMVDQATATITTIAGRVDADDALPNDPDERDPLRLNLPRISSMDYHQGRLLIPTDLTVGGDLVVMRQG